MINRELIRLKVLQIAYAFYQNDERNVASSEKELFFSMSKAHDLYMKLLALIVALHKDACRRLEIMKNSHARILQPISELERFTGNLFARQLEENVQLCSFLENESNRWDNDAEFVMHLFNMISESEVYQKYVFYLKNEHDYSEDKEIWRKLYKLFIEQNENLDAILEEKCLYWNDDKEIVDTFVLKTIKRFSQIHGAGQPLIAGTIDDDDKEFAQILFRNAVKNEEEYKGYMSEVSQNWDLSRLAFMDTIIMQIAIAEMINCPNVPLSVTIDMYVELAKLYSTDKSWMFVNGMLDQIARNLIDKRKILKVMNNNNN